jgi:thymidylate kinase
MIPIRSVVLEGVDCSGKSSLYSCLHKVTGFKYNIQDRSALSMLCYARLYGRDETVHRARLIEELCDANNVMVVLMPPLSVVLQRFRDRGDEFQDESSLTKLYRIFLEEVSKMDDVPNVLVVTSLSKLEDLTAAVAGRIQEYSDQTPGVFGKSISRWTKLMPRNEVNFRATFQIPDDHTDFSVYNDPHEGDYYNEIRHKCEDVIHDEISGKNPYGTPQGLDSRRFYYSSDTCISSIHFLPRDGRVKVVCTLRSTDAVKNGSIDLRFLSTLSTEVPKKFGWPADTVELTVNFNSLHVRNDKV